MKKIEIRKLNSLRAIAALMVLVSHYSNSTNFLNGVLGHGSGQIGVMIFFVLSGFLMSFLYLNKGFEVKTYIVSRLARVLPLFVFVVLLSFFSQQIFINGVFYKVLDVNSLISHLFLLSGVSVLWTIPTEIQFYILFIPLCWLFIYNKIYMYTLLFIVFFILYFFNFPNPQYDIDNILISGYIFRSLPYFFIGIIFGQLYLKLNTSFLKLQSNFYVLVIPIILIAYPEIYLLLFDYKYIMWNDIVMMVLLTALLAVILFLIPESNKLLSNSVGDFFGNISYSLYLIHVPVLELCMRIDKKLEYFNVVSFLVITVILSYISFVLIEKPSRQYIRKLINS